YDEAISWATKALHEQPNWATALRVAVTANALSDRMVEARAAMACLREVDPALRLGNLDRVAPPLRRAEGRLRFIESLRKAGLPEGPLFHLSARRPRSAAGNYLKVIASILPRELHFKSANAFDGKSDEELSTLLVDVRRSLTARAAAAEREAMRRASARSLIDLTCYTHPRYEPAGLHRQIAAV